MQKLHFSLNCLLSVAVCYIRHVSNSLTLVLSDSGTFSNTLTAFLFMIYYLHFFPTACQHNVFGNCMGLLSFSKNFFDSVANFKSLSLDQSKIFHEI